MITGISIHSIYVLDQDAARDFYVDTLGLQLGDDVDLGVMRWLTVTPPAQPDRRILLAAPGPPMVPDEVATQVRSLLTQGALGTTILTTEDCRATYEQLEAKGVEFTQEPVVQPYGIDCALRDPFGNHIRITQPTGS